MNLYKIAVCVGPNCSARFSADVKKRFEQLVAKKNLGTEDPSLAKMRMITAGIGPSREGCYFF